MDVRRITDTKDTTTQEQPGASRVLSHTLALIDSRPQTGYTPEWVAAASRVGDVTALAIALRH